MVPGVILFVFLSKTPENRTRLINYQWGTGANSWREERSAGRWCYHSPTVVMVILGHCKLAE